MKHESLDQQATAVLRKYVMAAIATGAIPVPAASAAIIAENALMVNHIAGAYGSKISVADIAKSIGLLGSANLAGRAVFVEAARLLSWGAAFTGAPALVSAIGAGTAGLQTYLIGLVAIEIAKQGGVRLSPPATAAILHYGRESFEGFRTGG
ncbi:DUF697 domain-containing protein [Achromobacter spanius]|uniref:DUF697 domain-containing protein n=1 Tax=Achromobacter spanius TaxID=217203 RepID=UPI000F8F9D08|nr:DUF697 domain-containing protein [Achromobacter spanius]AZS77612.1 DUF697 domain-containing protein [Achromobacter spanius]